MAKKDQLDEELQNSLRDIIKSCEREDDEFRKRQVKMYQKHERFWHQFQHLFWSENENIWRAPDDMDFKNEFSDEELEELGSFYDFVIDIFKAHGESIIAALAAQIPALRFLPDDADDDDDVLTARTYNKIADVVQRHNKAKLIFLRALFFLYINGIVFSYRYKDSDFKYGSYDIPDYGTQKTEKTTYVCKTCNYESEEPFGAKTENEYCPQCGWPGEAKLQTKEEEVPIQKGTKAFPKTRVKIDIYGGLHVKVPRFARNQDEFDYLGFYTDVSKNIAQDTYYEFYDEIEGESLASNERVDRTSTESVEIEEKNLVTISKWWLRRAALSREKDKGKREKLRQLFPEGVLVTVIGRNKTFISAIAETLDERWEIGQAGLSTYIHSDPICKPVVPIQEMKNQVGNLTMETIDHGIPSMFADPQVLSFDQYGKFEATPGYIYKAKPRTPTGNLAESFYTTDRATVSKEVPVFDKALDQAAQFALGSFPSVYGGPAEGKTRTFGEYAASRQMALQRLSIVWSLLTDWWVRTLSGAVTLYVETIVEDQSFAIAKDGSYVNVWIRQSEMKGKIGGVEPEASEGFPVSLMQKKDLIMKLMEMQNDYVNAALYTPENARVIQDVFALNELKLPGESQRVKQVLEIRKLSKGEPVEIDPDVDDDEVHIKTLISFLVDTIGLDMKETNPIGYAMCVQHLQMHQMNLLRKTLGAGGPGAEGSGQQPQSAAAGVEG